MTVLYLLRHGRTELNAAGLLRGHLDAPLDDLGRQEAAALADTFAKVTADVVLTSPLQRARHTAAAVADRCCRQVTADPGLMDRDYGPSAGNPRDDVEARYGSIDAAPGVESLDALDARVATAIAQQVAGRDVVIAVTHDAVLRSALHQLDPDTVPSRDVISQPTGCWNRIDNDNGSWHARVIGVKPGDERIPV